MQLTEDAIKQAKREYFRQYREKNRERILEKQRAWRSKPENKEKIALSQKRYWERKAREMNG